MPSPPHQKREHSKMYREGLLSWYFTGRLAEMIVLRDGRRKPMRNAALWAILSLPGLLALPVLADTFLAGGAGPSLLTAQDLSLAPVTEITGDFGLNSNDPAVNVFKIDISQPAEFSALTLFTGAFGVPDPELFLFNSQGFGVYFNDDISGANTQSCLPSSDALTSPCAPRPAGPPIRPLLPGDHLFSEWRARRQRQRDFYQRSFHRCRRAKCRDGST